MEFQSVLMPLLSRKSSSLQDALGRVGFTEYGLKIPVAYGLNITIYAPNQGVNWCKNEVEQFMYDKMVRMGGAIPFTLDWLDFELANGIMYFNSEIGIAVILDLNITELDRSFNSGINSGDTYSGLFDWIRGNQERQLRSMYGNNRSFKEFYKMQEVLADLINKQLGIKIGFILWPTWEMFFNKWYYTGLMRRGLVSNRRR